MPTRNDPDVTSVRLQAAVEQLGAALKESITTGLAKALAKALAEMDPDRTEWVLHADGRIE